MKYSKHNIFSRIKDSENYFIVNVLSGNADILNKEDAGKLKLLIEGGNPDDRAFTDELTEKGYLSDESEEEKLYRSKYLDFIDNREDEEIQIFFVTNYSCNFACSYCYQDQYSYTSQALTKEIVDAFFGYVDKEFALRRKYITIFGGEPLLGNPAQKELIAYLVEKSSNAGLPLCFVTNGYNLEEYIPVLQKGLIREVQVTLDGTAKVHDTRRSLKGGGKTFEKIANGIDACLENGININLRMVADKENIDDLPNLARYAIESGWTGSGLFKTQIGRNYELHHCQSAPEKLFDRLSLYEKIYELVKIHPHILEFHKPAWSLSKFLSENGTLPDPLFDSCPACKTEWAFDYTGSIYSCTATVGKSDELLGTFYPHVTRKEELIEKWETRDVTSIPECRNCPVQLACGGGCGSVAKNKSGIVNAPDCRPVKELMELGFSVYLNQ